MKKLVVLICCMFAVGAQAQSDRQVFEPVPAKVDGVLNGAAPSDAIILFDGSDMDAWLVAATDEPAKWEIGDDGSMTVRRGMRTIKTKQAFGDIQLHLEFRPSGLIEGVGQSRGNSGIFLHGVFELQVLDSWENPTYVNGQVGSVYLQHAPLVNVAREPGEWQSYDIIFEAPHYDANGDLTEPAYLTVLQNGVLVQNHVEIQGATYTETPEYSTRCMPYGWGEQERDCSGKMPLALQDHGQVVSYRNIWVREL